MAVGYKNSLAICCIVLVFPTVIVTFVKEMFSLTYATDHFSAENNLFSMNSAMASSSSESELCPIG